MNENDLANLLADLLTEEEARDTANMFLEDITGVAGTSVTDLVNFTSNQGRGMELHLNTGDVFEVTVRRVHSPQATARTPHAPDNN